MISKFVFRAPFYTTCAMSIVPLSEVKNLQYLKAAHRLHATRESTSAHSLTFCHRCSR